MNPQLQRLYNIARKPERRIVGLMSGTSLDGLDVALCRIAGCGSATRVTPEHFATVPYDDALKADIRTIFAKPRIEFEPLCLLNPYIGRLHGQFVLDCLTSWDVNPAAVDLVASHGQTVYHAPKSQHRRDKFPNATLQIGDGDHVAAVTGIITLSDFRQKHVAHGGEGAPLAVYGDQLMFSSPTENRILLNMGGIANFTYLPANQTAEPVFTTDTGPGNTLLDGLARRSLGRAYDENGGLAAQGVVEANLLRALKTNSFFDAPFPKTTGPEVFNDAYVEKARARSQTTQLSAADLMATLVQFSADTIADAIERVLKPGESYTIYLSGGGMHNPVLTAAIRRRLPACAMGRTDELGISGDAKEAVLFAVLANECVAGSPAATQRTPAPATGPLVGLGKPAVSMGKISFPH